MNIKPLGNRILVEPKQEEEKTKGGIYIPDSAKEKTTQGKVLAVGDGKDVNVKVSDVVVYESYAGTKIKDDGKQYLLMDIKDVLATMG